MTYSHIWPPPVAIFLALRVWEAFGPKYLIFVILKVSKKDDKVDLNDSSTKYTKIYLNSNIFHPE